MKSFFVVLSFVGLAASQHWGGQPGVPQDTPEVAAAKAAHFAALAKAQPQQQAPQQQLSQNQWVPPQQVHVNQWVPQQATPVAQAQQPWKGELALPPGFDQNGAPLPVQDTPEVLAERARHFSLYSSGKHDSQLGQQNFNAPPAPQPVFNPAPVQPTWNSAQPQPAWNPAPARHAWNPTPAQPTYHQNSVQPWQRPQATPHWNQVTAQPSYNHVPAQPAWNPAPVQQPFGQQPQSNFPVDTPEVAAAKAAHFAAHAQLGGKQWNQV